MKIENRKLKKKFTGGFTLPEVMIVIGFFVIMSATLSIGVSKFSNSINLTNLAYDMALSLRQTQVYGTSVKDRTSSGVSTFESGYGLIYFSSDKLSYAMFADDPDVSKRYNRRCGATSESVASVSVCETSSSKEFVKKFLIGRGNSISKFCATRPSGQKDCSDGSTASVLSYLAVSFMRPSPDAFIRTNLTPTSGDIPLLPSFYQSACIEMSSSDGTRKNSVTVSFTGFISVANACP